jgi:hypothetical protein
MQHVGFTGQLMFQVAGRGQVDIENPSALQEVALARTFLLKLLLLQVAP